MNEKTYNHGLERLRDPARLDLLEVERVVGLAMEGFPPCGVTVLDVGCGSGVFAECFTKRTCCVAGIDINEEMVKEASRIVPAGDFRIGSAEKIPFEARTFDIVFFGLVLHETDDLVQALTEARRVTRKRVVALEWPYKESEKGPPLAHRLEGKTIEAGAKKAGMQKIDTITLKELALYRMDLA
ncbi:MAG: class I SAM-dependent methyltransferase [Chitinivibrionales bacterium]|nr:class I SAM-dependent methyltransferase [Chitinivibrionales bacterium]